MDDMNIRVMGIFYLSSVVTRTFSRNGKKKVFHFSGFPLAYVKMLSSFFTFFANGFLTIFYYFYSFCKIKLSSLFFLLNTFQVLALIKSVISEG